MMIDKFAHTAYSNILKVVARIPAGRVATYGQIAKLAGYPRAARLTGQALRHCPDDSPIPWHRVINAQGMLSFPKDSPHYHLQRTRLQSEGIIFRSERIPLDRYQWQPADLDELLWKPENL